MLITSDLPILTRCTYHVLLFEDIHRLTEKKYFTIITWINLQAIIQTDSLGSYQTSSNIFKKHLRLAFAYTYRLYLPCSSVWRYPLAN